MVNTLEIHNTKKMIDKQLTTRSSARDVPHCITSSATHASFFNLSWDCWITIAENLAITFSRHRYSLVCMHEDPQLIPGAPIPRPRRALGRAEVNHEPGSYVYTILWGFCGIKFRDGRQHSSQGLASMKSEIYHKYSIK